MESISANEEIRILQPRRKQAQQGKRSCHFYNTGSNFQSSVILLSYFVETLTAPAVSSVVNCLCTFTAMRESEKAKHTPSSAA